MILLILLILLVDVEQKTEQKREGEAVHRTFNQ
jgi:hypothetical protein